MKNTVVARESQRKDTVSTGGDKWQSQKRSSWLAGERLGSSCYEVVAGEDTSHRHATNMYSGRSKKRGPHYTIYLNNLRWQ